MIATLFIVLVIANSFMYKKMETSVACVSAWRKIVIYKIQRDIEKKARSKNYK
jgi:hypothetical protein